MRDEQVAREPATRGFGWRKLQVLGGVLMVIALMIGVVLSRERPFIYPTVFSLPALIALILFRFLKPVGIILMGVVGLLSLVPTFFILREAVANPGGSYIIGFTTMLVGGLLAFVGAIPAFRGRKSPDLRSRLPQVIAVVFVLLLIFAASGSVAARIGKYGCDPSRIQLYFWPEGHESGELLPGEDFPENRKPHVELLYESAVGISESPTFEQSAIDADGGQFGNDPDCTEPLPRGGLPTSSDLTKEQSSVLLTCDGLSDVDLRATDEGARPAALEIDSRAKPIVTAELRATGSEVSYDSDVCGVKRVPSSPPS